MTLVTGAKLGPYEIEALIGRGGMGEVYRAHDPRLGRTVAIKILPPHLAGDADSLARFRREARAVAAVSHPNIVAVFDIGNQAATTFVVTELLEGETLRSRLERGRIPPDDALRIAAAIADGLAATHAKGIIHRDLKPENVFLTATGGVKILDFGLVTSHVPSFGVIDTQALTEPGLVMGTIGYMSPEQLSARPLTPATDIFSLGCVLFEMLDGRRPFGRDSGAEPIASVLRDNPFATNGDHGVAPELREMIERCLAKNPDDRFQNGTEAGDAIREALHRRASAWNVTMPTAAKRPPRPNRRLAAIGAAVLAAAALVALAWLLVAPRREVIDQGYAIRDSDLTGDAETRRLTALAMRADANGARPEAIELLREAMHRDPHAALPVAFLSSFVYHSGNRAEGLRLGREALRRSDEHSSSYERLLCRYLYPENPDATSMALATSILELRPDAWRLRLSLAHQHMSRRENQAALAQIVQIDVSAPDDRRLAIVLADRASFGDIAGATRELERSRLPARPPLMAYARGRIAWSSGKPAEAAKFFDAAVESATVRNLASVASDSHVLAGIARIGAGDIDGALRTLDAAAVAARAAALPIDELQASGFAAYAARKRGDIEGSELRLQRAMSLAQPGTNDYDALRILGMRWRSRHQLPRVAENFDGGASVTTLVDAREAFMRGDTATAKRLLQQARSEGVDATYFGEEASLLAWDLGERPVRHWRPDPPYANRLRFIAIWELP